MFLLASPRQTLDCRYDWIGNANYCGGAQIPVGIAEILGLGLSGDVAAPTAVREFSRRPISWAVRKNLAVFYPNSIIFAAFALVLNSLLMNSIHLQFKNPDERSHTIKRIIDMRLKETGQSTTLSLTQ